MLFCLSGAHLADKRTVSQRIALVSATRSSGMALVYVPVPIAGHITSHLVIPQQSHLSGLQYLRHRIPN
jgi:hypothetical protein